MREKIRQYYVKPRYTYNIDKKGFILRAVGRLKRIFSKALYKDRKRRNTI